MSTEGKVGPKEFAQLTPAERKAAEETAKKGAEEAASRMGGFGDMLGNLSAAKSKVGSVKSLFESRGPGMDIEEIEAGLPSDLPDGVSLMVRGFTRWIGLDEIPPIAEILAGVYRTVNSE